MLNLPLIKGAQLYPIIQYGAKPFEGLKTDLDGSGKLGGTASTEFPFIVPGASAYQIAGLFNGLTLSAGSCEKYSDDTLSGWAITLKEEKAPRSAMFLNAGSLAATEALIKTMLTPSETE